MAYYKPQSPIKNGEDHIYPLTTYDQIIMPDGTRWNGEASSGSGSGEDVTLEQLGILATAEELNYMDGVISNVQMQLDDKIPNSRMVNGQVLSEDITLTASDVGADESGAADAALESAKAYTDAEITEWIGDTTVSAQINTAIGQVSQQISQKASTANYSATLSSSGWSSSAPYTQTVNVSGILATDVPFVDVDMSDATTDSAGTALTDAWNLIGRVTANAGSITAYCYKKKPTIDISLILKVVR